MKPNMSGIETVTFPYSTYDNIMKGSMVPVQREAEVAIYYSTVYLHFQRPESYLGCLDSDIIYNLGDPTLATIILN
jgi:hypothetical protein